MLANSNSFRNSFLNIGEKTESLSIIFLLGRKGVNLSLISGQRRFSTYSGCELQLRSVFQHLFPVFLLHSSRYFHLFAAGRNCGELIGGLMVGGLRASESSFCVVRGSATRGRAGLLRVPGCSDIPVAALAPARDCSQAVARALACA